MAEHVECGKKYEYNGKRYLVLYCDDVETKDATDANWYPAVIYKPDEGRTTKMYVRRMDDFLAKFTLSDG